MVQQVSPRDFTGEVLVECRHHWIIQAATGPVSAGVCRNCGAVRDFKNYVGTTHWGEEKDGNLAHAGLPKRALNSLAEDDEE